MKFRNASIVAAALFAAAGMAYAQEQGTKPAAKQPELKEKQASKKLAVGDKAPPLAIEEWVKGRPVTGFEKGKTYVVEFWATWCGPCIASMPHLTELQKEYKDRVTIIGVTAEDPNNSLEDVEEMVKNKGEVMGYTVAFDEGTTTKDAYMKAAGRGGIPCSFVVDPEGKIAYIGHPMWLDMPLEGIAKGNWDPKEGEAKIKEAEASMMKVFQTVRSDPEEALALLEQFEKDYPKAAGIFGDQKYSLLVKTGDERASEVGRKMVDKAIKGRDPQKLNAIAWGIVNPKADVKNKDLDLAMKAATKAVEFTEEKDAAILDTLARVHFWKGDLDKAVEWQKKAVEHAEGDMKADLEEVLEEYEAAKDKK